MLTMAIIGCIVFLAVLISSYWWGFHSRFSLGTRLVDAKESTQGESSKMAARSSADVLEFDYVFERNRTSAAQSAAKSSVVSLQAHRASKQAKQSAVASNSSNAQSGSAEKDDLKKIWGIGVVFENLLNSKGVYTFEQLANISDEMKEDVRGSLGIYSNRIERDEWVSQATAFFDSKNSGQRVA